MSVISAGPRVGRGNASSSAEGGDESPSATDNYHRATKHTPRTVAAARPPDLATRPPPFHDYGDAERLPLESSVAGPLLDAGAGIVRSQRGRDYGGGTIHWRAYSSAGALFPVEAYVAAADSLYSFDALSHALVRIAEGKCPQASRGRRCGCGRRRRVHCPDRYPCAHRLEVRRARLPARLVGRRHDACEPARARRRGRTRTAPLNGVHRRSSERHTPCRRHERGGARRPRRRRRVGRSPACTRVAANGQAVNRSAPRSLSARRRGARSWQAARREGRARLARRSRRRGAAARARGAAERGPAAVVAPNLQGDATSASGARGPARVVGSADLSGRPTHGQAGGHGRGCRGSSRWHLRRGA
jgi:hypothetical protein